jgi:hypothetical protein
MDPVLSNVLSRPIQYSILCPIQSYFVLSFPKRGPILSYPLPSCPIMADLVRAYPILPDPLLSCAILFCPILFCPILFCPILFCPILFCPILSCPILSSSYYVFLSSPVLKGTIGSGLPCASQHVFPSFSSLFESSEVLLCSSCVWRGGVHTVVWYVYDVLVVGSWTVINGGLEIGAGTVWAWYGIFRWWWHSLRKLQLCDP